MKTRIDQTASDGGQTGNSGGPEPLDAPPVRLARLRERVEAGSAPGVWRSLDELAGTPEFQRLVENEFPRYAPAEWRPDGADRRDFLKLAGAAVGLAGLTACTKQPAERIVPYVEQPENLVPGKPQYYATAMTVGGYAIGLLAESHMGRPTKVSGNPSHPATGGGSDVLAQASTLVLYDPDRSTSLERVGKLLGWDAFLGDLGPVLRAQEALQGEGLRILSGTVTSPLLAAQRHVLLDRFPLAEWVEYEPINDDQARRAAQRAFGELVDVRYDLSQADVVVALDSDFLTHGPGHLRYASDFAARRQVRSGKKDMNRLYSLEATPTATGASADHRLPVRTAEIGRFTAALAGRLGVAAAGAAPLGDETLDRWLEAVAADLEAHRGRSVVIPGRFADENVHVLAHAINEALGNVGATVIHQQPVAAQAAVQLEQLVKLVAEMETGSVNALFILGANPVYEVPAGLDFASALGKVALSVHLGLYKDETGVLCRWHVPQSHYLEGWGDARAFDGTVSLVQPLIEPLYSSKTDTEMVAALLGTEASDYDQLRAFWRSPQAPVALGDGDFEAGWRQALLAGFVPGTQSATVDVTVAAGAPAAAASALGAAGGGAGLELVLRPDPSLYDGRYANNPWLQELPKPITKMTWDQVLLISPETAAELGVETGEVVTVACGERSLEAPAWVQPGQAEGALTLWLGWGHQQLGNVANGLGANAQKLRGVEDGWALAATVERTGRTEALATTQLHFNLTDYSAASSQAEARHLVRHGTLSELEHPEFVHAPEHHIPQGTHLFDDWVYEGHAWGMAVDLTTCTGCNACVIACQAENNIPTVGKAQVLAGREMHWIRIDRYYDGGPEDPKVHHQPVMCQHCERAPCEVVCPVGATVHGFEGLNEMVYNRCIGTRYCSNNCPYKVRRFNFFLYNDKHTPTLKMARNPDVSVRSRGVMEKCTYCVQRINAARIDAKKEGRARIRDGEVRTACQEACPSGAIVFGDINDPDSVVSRWKRDALNYDLLPELANKPRTSYLAKITNPNPALGGGDAEHHGPSSPDATDQGSSEHEASDGADGHGAGSAGSQEPAGGSEHASLGAPLGASLGTSSSASAKLVELGRTVTRAGLRIGTAG